VLGYDHAESDERERMQGREKELLEQYFWKSPAPLNFRIDHPEDAQ
jgi:ssRNA-specific RNase YbeY (16S rRNA maturation enzyme)